MFESLYEVLTSASTNKKAPVSVKKHSLANQLVEATVQRIDILIRSSRLNFLSLPLYPYDLTLVTVELNAQRVVRKELASALTFRCHLCAANAL